MAVDIEEDREAGLHAVVHCDGADRDLVAGLLRELGADWSPLESCGPPDRLLADGRLDLALADVEREPGRLDALAAALSACPGPDAPPLIVLSRPERADGPLHRVAQRFHGCILHRPFGRDDLEAALRDGLAVRDRQRRERDLLLQLREAEERADRLRLHAEHDARRRTELLAAISHNLRTPINEIVLFCHLAQGSPGGTPADVERLAAGLLGGVEALRELVDDLLDIARYDLGTLEFRPSVFPLRPFLERTLLAARSRASARGLAFRVEVEAADPLPIRADPDTLARVLQNLASNAVKFTDRGEVVVRARVEPGAGLTLAVSDTGRGIPPEMQRSIFDEFAQVDNPARQRIHGTGLGLAICRRLVDALRGRIDLESTPGVGSTFTVTLPADVLDVD